MSKIRRTTSCGEVVPFQRVLLEPERRCRSGRSGGSGRAAPPSPKAIARAGGAAAIGDAEAKVLPVTDGLQVGELAAGDKQVDAGVAEPERREPLQLPAETERQRRAGDDRVDRASPGELVVGQDARRRRRRTPPRARRRCPGRIERPAAARWPPKRSRWPEHAARPACRSKARNRAAASPSSRRPCPRSGRPGGGSARRAARRRSRSRPRASSSPATT